MFVLATYVFLVFIHDITLTSESVCYETRLVNGKEVVSEKCCDGFYKSSNGRCSECAIGSYGDKCRFNCTFPFYGRLCYSLCECERCHHIYGCEESNVFTTESSNYKETIREWNEEIILTEIPKLQNKEDTSVKYEEDDRESAVTMDKVIIIIVASSASTAVSMVICCIFVLIIRRLLCKKHRTDRAGTFNAGIATNGEITTHPSTLQEQHFTVNTFGNSDSQYETIDESSIIEMSNVRTDEERLASRNTNISSSSSDSKISNASGVASEDTEGYIHPYNTLEENWQNKGYQYTLCIAKTYTSKIPKQKLTAEENSAKTSHFMQ